MRVKVLFFAASREVAGTSETQIELQDDGDAQPNTAALLQALLYRIQMHWMQLHAAQMPPFQSPYDCSYLLL
jgi:molybdopterin converting factor small subunit